MADDEDAEEEHAVELGTGADVEGAPVARVASRLKWPAQKSRILELEGESEIRTPEGPRTVAAVLEDVETTYFQKRQEFVESIEDVVGRGPVATAED